MRWTVRRPVRRIRDRAGMNHLVHAYSAQLGREWEHLRYHRPSLRRARSWSTGARPEATADADADTDDSPLDEILHGLDDLQRLVDATDVRRGADPIVADAILLQLVERAGDDELAGRVVIQRILGGLISQAVRHRRHDDDIDPAEIIVAAAWIALRRYDTTRRPHHVAEALISDARYQAFQRPLRRLSATEKVVPIDRLELRAAAPHGTPFERLADVVRAARLHGVPDADLQLIRDLLRSESSSIVAAERGVTARTIRNHRERAVSHIRAAVLAA
jgi:hypothetical protein